MVGFRSPRRCGWGNLVIEVTGLGAWTGSCTSSCWAYGITRLCIQKGSAGHGDAPTVTNKYPFQENCSKLQIGWFPQFIGANDRRTVEFLCQRQTLPCCFRKHTRAQLTAISVNVDFFPGKDHPNFLKKSGLLDQRKLVKRSGSLDQRKLVTPQMPVLATEDIINHY